MFVHGVVVVLRFCLVLCGFCNVMGLSCVGRIAFICFVLCV